MNKNQPSQRELFSKVEAALAAFSAGRYMVGVPEQLADDLADVGIDTQHDFWKLLPRLLEELKNAGPSACYKGWRPAPEIAGEHLIKGLKLWAYVWKSEELGLRVYLKFCLKENAAGKAHYLHVRIHKDRPPK